MTIAFAGHSTNSLRAIDTVPRIMWLPMDDALYTLGKAKTAQILEQRVVTLKLVIDSLNSRIANKETIIKEFEKNEAKYEQQIITLRSEIQDHNDVRNAVIRALDEQEKLVKKLRRKVKWTAIAGIFTTAAAIILPIIL